MINKAVAKKLDALEEAKQEIDIMSKLKHENILEFHSHFEDDRKIYLLLDYAAGGTLFDRLAKEEKFSEIEAAQYLKQVIEAV